MKRAKAKPSNAKRKGAPKQRPASTPSLKIQLAQLARERDEELAHLAEALEQQTATSNVLEVISAAPGELERVFNAMLENATRVCGAQFGTMNLYEGELVKQVAHYNVPRAFAESVDITGFKPHPNSGLGTVARTKQLVHIDDLRTQAPYLEGNPAVVALADLAGARTLVIVPMLKGNNLVGTIGIYRKEVQPFTDKQLELVSNFAKQAVIAIENTRLLKELRQRTDDLSEALEQQTATSDVLRTISSSPNELQPVFDAILSNARRICEAKFAHLLNYDGEKFHAAAMEGAPPEFVEFWSQGRSRSRQFRLRRSQ